MKTEESGIFPYQQFENEYAKFTGSNHAVGVNTGTAALHLALASLDIKAGDEVIVPDFTMAACAFAVSYTGASPIFVDCKDDLTIDETKIEELITYRTRAIMPVHIYGRLCNMEAIMKIANRWNLHVIEDACEAQGRIYASWAHVTCYSLYKNKIIHAEEGGVCTTDDEKLAKKMNFLKCMAFTAEHNYEHPDIGFNYRMPDSTAKMALESLRMARENIIKRKQVISWFDSYIREDFKMPRREAPWVYDFMPDNKQGVVQKLKQAGVPYREFFKPLSLQLPYRHPLKMVNKNAQLFGYRGLYFPIHPDMTEEEVKTACKVLDTA